MAEDLLQSSSKDDMLEEEIQDDTGSEVHNPLEDLGYHDLESVGHSQEMIFDEQDNDRKGQI